MSPLSTASSNESNNDSKNNQNDDNNADNGSKNSNSNINNNKRKAPTSSRPEKEMRSSILFASTSKWSSPFDGGTATSSASSLTNAIFGGDASNDDTTAMSKSAADYNEKLSNLRKKHEETMKQQRDGKSMHNPTTPCGNLKDPNANAKLTREELESIQKMKLKQRLARRHRIQARMSKGGAGGLEKLLTLDLEEFRLGAKSKSKTGGFQDYEHERSYKIGKSIANKQNKNEKKMHEGPVETNPDSDSQQSDFDRLEENTVFTIEEITHAAASLIRQTGMVILKSSRSGRPTSALARGREATNTQTNGVNSHSPSTQSASSLDIDIPSGQIFPGQLLQNLATEAQKIERQVCDKLDQVHPHWRLVLPPQGKTQAEPQKLKIMDKKTTTKQDQGCRSVQQAKDLALASSSLQPSQPLPKPTEVHFSYHEVAHRCHGRIDVRYNLHLPPFTSPSLLQNPLLYGTANDFLHGDANLVYAGLIYSVPHSYNQPWHMDGKTLFPEWGMDVPPYALNVFVPLKHVTEELGPTELVPGSHGVVNAAALEDSLLLAAQNTDKHTGLATILTEDQEEEEDVVGEHHHVVAPLLQAGDALLYDYRICHRGTANLSLHETRPMLYLMYARGWFKEHINFGKERLFQDGGGEKGKEGKEGKEGKGGEIGDRPER